MIAILLALIPLFIELIKLLFSKRTWSNLGRKLLQRCVDCCQAIVEIANDKHGIRPNRIAVVALKAGDGNKAWEE